jgi:hypothetical protein
MESVTEKLVVNLLMRLALPVKELNVLQRARARMAALGFDSTV